jgi:competence protein ComEC
MNFGDTSALLTGDIEKVIERRLAGTIAHSDLLKVAHHGSATSTTPELLAAVHPRYAVISVGYRSIFGHPKLQVLSRLTAANVQTFRTDIDGAVTFYLDGKTVTPAPTH